MEIAVNCLEALPDDRKLREVTAYGRIRQRADGFAEVECQVVFAGREDFLDDMLGPFTGQTTTIWIGVGTIPAVKIGSLWRGRERIRSKPFLERVETENFSPAEKNPMTIGELSSAPREPGKPQIDDYPIGQNAAMPVFWLRGPGLRRAIVPIAEVVRYFFCPTTSFAKLTYHGHYPNHPLDSRRLFEPKLSGFVEGTDGELKIHAHRQLTPKEVAASARMCACTESLRAFLGIFRYLQTHRFGETPTYPVTSFPLPGTHLWRFHARWIAVVGPDGELHRKRLITRIVSIEDDLGMKKVIVVAPVPDLLNPREAAHRFRDDGAHPFRSIVAQRSDQSSPMIPG